MSGHPSLLDQLLSEQGQLTAVDSFARRHDLGLHAGSRYRALLPATPPAPGQQLAFEVDLDRCSGCKSCVTACHSLNGLDDGESWRDTGMLVSEDPARPVVQTVTTACHHCLDPACLNGCPVLAYEKDPVTGIVRHLDDQCIGCSYCILKCPYEVPKYNAARGIVRKCDMCSQRLAQDEAPACVQACPNEAIRITVVDSAAQWPVAGVEWLADAPSPSITQPTTRYVTRHSSPGLVSPTRGQLVAQPPHWPLVWMLVLTQMAAGLYLAAALERGSASAPITTPSDRTAWLALHAGLLASVFHLGRPLRAWRSFLGWRTSWMSREIILFGLFSGASTATLVFKHPDWNFILAIATAMIGQGAVVASAMVYIDTKRSFWRPANSLPRFIGSSLMLGFAGAAWVSTWTTPSASSPARVTGALVLGAILIRMLLFARTCAWRRQVLRDPHHVDTPNVALLRAQYGWTTRTDPGLLMVSTTAAGLALVDLGGLQWLWSPIVLATLIAAVVLERFLFFTTAAHRGMPGIPS